MEGITQQAMLATKQYIQHSTCPNTMILVYLYFLVSIPCGLCQLPLIIILFPLNYLVGLFITHQVLSGPIP
jgi:hypothetical protein